MLHAKRDSRTATIYQVSDRSDAVLILNERKDAGFEGFIQRLRTGEFEVVIRKPYVPTDYSSVSKIVSLDSIL